MLRNFFKSAMVIGAIIVGSSRTLQAQVSGAPATMPAAAGAATQPADASTPKGALTLLSRATQNGDTTAVRGLLNVTNPTEQKVADALMQRTQAYTAFRKAAIKAFGEDAANQLAGDPAAEAAEWENHIQQADVKIDNNKARIDMGDKPVNLVKVGDTWKLSMETLTAEMPPGDVDNALQQIKQRADIVTQTTDEMSKGKYKSPEEVSDAMRAKLASVMLQASPTTRPTSGPAGE